MTGHAQAADRRPFFDQRDLGPGAGAPQQTQSAYRRRRLVAARVLHGLAGLFSIEASFALFVFAGRYKALPELRGFPVDFTALFFAATCCLIAWAIVSGRMKPVPLSLSVLLMILFSEFAAASLLWSSLDALNTDKALRSLLLTSPSFFAAYMLGQDRVRRRRFVRMLAWLSCGIILYWAYYHYVLGLAIENRNEYSGVWPEDANNYLEYGSHASILFIILLVLAAFGSLKQLCIAIFGAGAMLYALMVIGGRGPLALALLALPLLALGLIRRAAQSLRSLWRLLAFLLGLVALAAVGYMALERLDGSGAALEHFRTLDRYESEDTSSMDKRLEGRDFAFRLWLQKPIFGWGIGEFRVKDSYLEYPHNLLLELLMETGIVGAFLFFAVCAIAVSDCMGITGDQPCDWTDAAIALLFLTELASHLTVQGYLADDRIFLAYMGLVIGSRSATGLPFPRPVPELADRPVLADRANH